MKFLTLAATLIFSASAIVYGQPNGAGAGAGADPKTEQHLKSLRREFFEAVRRGDRAVLERLIADGFAFVHTTGVWESRKDFIDRTVAQASSSPEIEFLDENLRTYNGATAVWVTRSVVRPRGGGPEINSRATETLAKFGEQWRWVSVHSTGLPTRPQPAAVAPETMKSYTGQYQISLERILTIAVENGQLKGKAPGIRQIDLIPRSETEFVWFSPDSNVDMRLIFTQDAGGGAEVLLRSDGRDVWRAKRIK